MDQYEEDLQCVRCLPWSNETRSHDKMVNLSAAAQRANVTLDRPYSEDHQACDYASPWTDHLQIDKLKTKQLTQNHRDAPFSEWQFIQRDAGPVEENQHDQRTAEVIEFLLKVPDVATLLECNLNNVHAIQNVERDLPNCVMLPSTTTNVDRTEVDTAQQNNLLVPETAVSQEGSLNSLLEKRDRWVLHQLLNFPMEQDAESDVLLSERIIPTSPAHTSDDNVELLNGFSTCKGNPASLASTSCSAATGKKHKRKRPPKRVTFEYYEHLKTQFEKLCIERTGVDRDKKPIYKRKCCLMKRNAPCSATFKASVKIKQAGDGSGPTYESTSPQLFKKEFNKFKRHDRRFHRIYHCCSQVFVGSNEYDEHSQAHNSTPNVPAETGGKKRKKVKTDGNADEHSYRTENEAPQFASFQNVCDGRSEFEFQD